MKKLLLLRHAKSSWENLNIRDFARPLNSRGIRASKKIGMYLYDNNIFPDLIITSPSVRTVDTISNIFKSVNRKCKVIKDKSLYLGESKDYNKILSIIDNSVDTAMIVGHNYGIEEFASKISDKQIIMKTATLVIFNVAADDFSNTKSYILENIIYPRKL